MNLKSLLFKFFILTILTALTGSVSFAQDESGDPSDSQTCKDELNKAKDDLEDLVYNGKSSKSTDAASEDGTKPASNPMSDMVNQIAQGQQKQAEMAQKAMEQNRQLDNERFKQLNELNDKIHEFQRGDFKRRTAIKEAETTMKKQLAEIRIACQAKAEEDYNKEWAEINAKSSSSNYSSNSMSRLSGSNKRMQASLNSYHKRRCLNNPATLEKKQLVKDEYDAKIHNFKIAAEEIASDVSYTQGKIGLVEGHMAEQKRQLATSLAQQQAALQQQQQMAMMGMAFSMMTAGSGAEEEKKEAQEFRSADETLKKWRKIQEQCRNATDRPIKIPSDIYYVFSDVNEACRGKDSPSKCVDDSNRESEDRPAARSTGI